MKELDSFVYNNSLELYLIINDGWKIILELLGGGLYWKKYFKKIFRNLTPYPSGRRVWNLQNSQMSQNRWLRHASWCLCSISWLSVYTFIIMEDCPSYKVAVFKSGLAETSSFSLCLNQRESYFFQSVKLANKMTSLSKHWLSLG